MSLNHDLSDLFSRMAAVMEIKGENAFKAIAFSKVSRVLKDTGLDIKEQCAAGTLGDIEGIGPSSRKIIEEYVQTGRSSDYEQLVSTVPPGLIELLQVPGLGPKTIALFWKERGVTSKADLNDALEKGKLEGLKGIGAKKLDSIRQGLAFIAQSGGRLGIGEVLPIADALLNRLREIDQVAQAQVAGSLRRGRETIGDVDILCSLKSGSSGQAVSDLFVKFPEVKRILGQGQTKASVMTEVGLQVDLRIVPAENFGAALLYFTGSKDHNVHLRGDAQEMALTLNEWGLYSLKEYDKEKKKPGEAPSAHPIASKTEEDVYRKLGLAYILPELREEHGEIEAARAGRLPKLIERKDLAGDLHCHTRASDGAATIEEMARAAAALGYKYLAITDHSKSQVIANGLDKDRLLKHVKEIRKLDGRVHGVTLLAGCEVDIMADGSLDFEDAVLAELDFVVASPHVALKQESQAATARILKAIDNPYVNVIGHPTGRLINRREGLPLDFPRIYKAAAQSATALEINAGWPRLDLDDVHARAAVEAGVFLAIDTDAHSAEGLAAIDLGLTVARRAWVQPQSVINCWPEQKLRQFVKSKRPT